MTYIQGPIPPSGPGSIPPRVAGAEPAKPAEKPDRHDTVAISEIARLKAKLAEVPEIRQELIDRVKAEIEAGSYDTIDTVRAAAEKLLAELREDGIL